ncbi:MAG: aminotransferase class I/II-fold pyridoxal phosphate-dependent enzyme [Clostridia bacterium]|nr:aminotransferase class I/II-fold pyridoxal phosphate-dependent enzyme [Clostridia bacterium]
MYYCEMKKEELSALYSELCAKFEEIKSKGLKLDMSRGKPGADQLCLTDGLLTAVSAESGVKAANGLDCRNYGVLDGIPEAKQIFADILGVPTENVIVGGSSSLNLMYDEISRAMLFGVAGGEKPWGAQGKIKFLCPVPGYDRHFAICELMGIEMINVPMTENGPDMDVVERYVESDGSIKGIWCVPKYANPDGCVYSDETVRRFAALKPKAKDFRIFWDNAYVVHDLYGYKPLANLFELAKEYGNENLPIMFTSTSKISHAGSGISAMAASSANIAKTKKSMGIQTIGFDKINQLRHARYFGNAENVIKHMEKHADILRPKFEAVLTAFEKELKPIGVATWSKPKGGYFISLNVVKGCAKRVYELAKEAGVTLTPAGAPYPYGIDPEDENLRIAPSFPPVSELSDAVAVLCLCVKMAAAEKYLA